MIFAYTAILPILIIGHRYTGRMEAHGDGPMAAVPGCAHTQELEKKRAAALSPYLEGLDP
jgi:hypothetical protein